MGFCKLLRSASKRPRPGHVSLYRAGCRWPWHHSGTAHQKFASSFVWFSLSHHSLHNLVFALVIAAIASALAAQKWKTGLLALLSFHIHLFEDVLGSRGPEGYQWPIPYLAPISSNLQLVWGGQWGLNAWQNILITAVLLLITLWLAWRRGFSPLEMVSVKADAALVATLRRRAG